MTTPTSTEIAGTWPRRPGSMASAMWPRWRRWRVWPRAAAVRQHWRSWTTACFFGSPYRQVISIERPATHFLPHTYNISPPRGRGGGVAVAGWGDRPRSADVLALLALVLAPEPDPESSPAISPYRGLTDRALFAERLEPGQRSARFVDSSPVNRDFETVGHQ